VTTILILEDNEDRIRQFRVAAGTIAPDLPVRVWRSAPTMIADLADCLEYAAIISLDHDLMHLPGDIDDPGSGYDVTKLLSELIPVCPVIIHTSNAERRNWMVGALSMGGWQFDCVYPSGDDWIEREWAPLVRQRLGRH
jgi:hypothetical protein